MERGRVYNNFYTPELWDQVNKQNKRILDDKGWMLYRAGTVGRGTKMK